MEQIIILIVAVISYAVSFFKLRMSVKSEIVAKIVNRRMIQNLDKWEKRSYYPRIANIVKRTKTLFDTLLDCEQITVSKLDQLESSINSMIALLNGGLNDQL